MKVLVAGKGKVGQGLLKKIPEANGVDKGYDVLHVCFPYSKDFVEEVVSIIEEQQVNLVIIHSTVLPETCEKIHFHCNHEVAIAYAPTTDQHNNIQMEKKMVAAFNKEDLKEAVKELERCGIECDTSIKSVKALEAGKLFSTLYYGWCIIFQKEIHSMCEKLDINYDEAYVKWNKFYNGRYNRTDFVRPILKQMEGKIGGTCVFPNAELLNKFFPNDLTKFLLEKNNAL